MIHSKDYNAIERVANHIHTQMVGRNQQFIVITGLRSTLLREVQANYETDQKFRARYPNFSHTAAYAELVDALSYNKFGIWIHQYEPGVHIAGRMHIVNDILERDGKGSIPELIRLKELSVEKA
jgi:hypothetical protein